MKQNEAIHKAYTPKNISQSPDPRKQAGNHRTTGMLGPPLNRKTLDSIKYRCHGTKPSNQEREVGGEMRRTWATGRHQSKVVEISEQERKKEAMRRLNWHSSFSSPFYFLYKKGDNADDVA
ncbi:hypothetical protein E3N88_24704 [Mikania micrantha]|uniref:Uncharacterized protein n=1 Tax=Mikania micrantha TaxID=192012 RepID=A0A5N6N413_9ASTR|nr:hypothetical protein E3N88_24704 [Mikania micrantha]